MADNVAFDRIPLKYIKKSKNETEDKHFNSLKQFISAYLPNEPTIQMKQADQQESVQPKSVSKKIIRRILFVIVAICAAASIIIGTLIFGFGLLTLSIPVAIAITTITGVSALSIFISTICNIAQQNKTKTPQRKYMQISENKHEVQTESIFGNSISETQNEIPEAMLEIKTSKQTI